jgi:hypothetical protein
VNARERFNFDFYKIDLRSFAEADEGREIASSYLDALAHFIPIIVDPRPARNIP